MAQKLPSLTRDQLDEVIRKPIEKAAATIDPQLVERLLNDCSAEMDQLPGVAAASTNSPASPQVDMEMSDGPQLPRQLTLYLCVPKIRFGVDAASGRHKLAS